MCHTGSSHAGGGRSSRSACVLLGPSGPVVHALGVLLRPESQVVGAPEVDSPQRWIPHLISTPDPGSRRNIESWVGPSLKASGPHVMGSTARLERSSGV